MASTLRNFASCPMHHHPTVCCPVLEYVPLGGHCALQSDLRGPMTGPTSSEVVPARRAYHTECPVERSLLLNTAVASQDGKCSGYRDPGQQKYTAGGVTVSRYPFAGI